MPTAGDLITRALGLLGVLEATETAGAADLANGLTSLNSLLESLALQRQTIHYVARVTKSLTSGTSSYTIGTGGSINVVRPIWIDRVSVLTDGTETSELPLGTPLSVAQYQALADKTQTAAYPTAIYYDHAWSTGLGNIIVYPVPNASTAKLVLYLPTPLSAFSDTSSSVSLPTGWRRALEYNLAVELAPLYNAPISPLVVERARMSLADIKRANFRMSELGFDPGLTGVGADYDIITDA